MTTKKANKKSSKKSESARRAPTKSAKPMKAQIVASSAAKQSTTKPAKAKSPKQPSGLDLAAEILSKSGKPMNARAIAKRVVAAGWETKGATPHATLYSAIARDIQQKGIASRFKKTGRGQFAWNGKDAAR